MKTQTVEEMYAALQAERRQLKLEEKAIKAKYVGFSVEGWKVLQAHNAKTTEFGKRVDAYHAALDAQEKES